MQGISQLKTWIFRILINIAKTPGQQESRSVRFSALTGPDDEAEEDLEPETRDRPLDLFRHWKAS